MNARSSTRSVGGQECARRSPECCAPCLFGGSAPRWVATKVHRSRLRWKLSCDLITVSEFCGRPFDAAQGRLFGGTAPLHVADGGSRRSIDGQGDFVTRSDSDGTIEPKAIPRTAVSI